MLTALETRHETEQGTVLLATFALSGSFYGIKAIAVQEIIRLRPMTEVPHAALAVLGVINLRGRIVTVLDTAVLLGLGRSMRDENSRVIIVEDRDESVGLVVDSMAEVLECRCDASEPVPANAAPEQREFLKCIYRLGGKAVALLDASGLLASASDKQ